MEGAEHELGPLDKQGNVLLLPEAAQILKPSRVCEVVKGDIGLKAKLLHGVQHIMEPVFKEHETARGKEDGQPGPSACSTHIGTRFKFP